MSTLKENSEARKRLIEESMADIAEYEESGKE